MIISDDKKLEEIQKEFNAKFPYLKIKFYRKEHQSNEGSTAAELLDPRQTIGQVRSTGKSEDVSISGYLKVKTFEQIFADKYGLNVQVFRQSGDLWLQTTSTDDWTLNEQNLRAEIALNRQTKYQG